MPWPSIVTLQVSAVTNKPCDATNVLQAKVDAQCEKTCKSQAKLKTQDSAHAVTKEQKMCQVQSLDKVQE